MNARNSHSGMLRVAIIALVALFALSACDVLTVFSGGGGSGGGGGGGSSESDLVALARTNLTNDLTDAGLTEAEVTAIVDGAVGGISSPDTNNDTESVLTGMVEGAQRSISGPDDFSDAEREALIETITGSAVGTIGEASTVGASGIRSSNVQDIIAAIVAASVGVLDETFPATVPNTAPRSSTGGAMRRLSAAGVSVDTLGPTVRNITASAVSALADGGLPGDAEAIGNVTRTVTSRLGSTGVITGNDVTRRLRQLTNEVSGAATRSLGAAGVDNTTAPDALERIAQNATAGLREIDLGPDATENIGTVIQDVTSEVTRTVTESLAQSGVSGINITVSVQVVVRGTTNGLKEVGDDINSGVTVDQTLIDQAVRGAATGGTRASTDLGSTVSATDLQDALDAEIESLKTAIADLSTELEAIRTQLATLVSQAQDDAANNEPTFTVELFADLTTVIQDRAQVDTGTSITINVNPTDPDSGDTLTTTIIVTDPTFTEIENVSGTAITFDTTIGGLYLIDIEVTDGTDTVYGLFAISAVKPDAGAPQAFGVDLTLDALGVQLYPGGVESFGGGTSDVFEVGILISDAASLASPYGDESPISDFDAVGFNFTTTRSDGTIAPGTYTLDTAANDPQSPVSGRITYVELYADADWSGDPDVPPSGFGLATSESEFVGGLPAGTFTNAEVVTSAEVVVTGNPSSGYTFDWSITTASGSYTGVYSGPVDRFLGDDTIGLLSGGQARNGSFSARGDWDVYAFPVTAGTSYEIAVDDEWAGGSFNADTIVEVYQSTSNTTIRGADTFIAASSDQQDKVTNPLGATATADGYFIILVESGNPGTTGYRITASAATTTTPVPAPFNIDLSAAELTFTDGEFGETNVRIEVVDSAAGQPEASFEFGLFDGTDDGVVADGRYPLASSVFAEPNPPALTRVQLDDNRFNSATGVWEFDAIATNAPVEFFPSYAFDITSRLEQIDGGYVDVAQDATSGVYTLDWSLTTMSGDTIVGSASGTPATGSPTTLTVTTSDQLSEVDFTGGDITLDYFGGDSESGYNTDVTVTVYDATALTASTAYFELNDSSADADLDEGSYGFDFTAGSSAGVGTWVDYIDTEALLPGPTTARGFATPESLADLNAFNGSYIESVEAYGQITSSGSSVDVTIAPDGTYTVSWTLVTDNGTVTGSVSAIPTVNDYASPISGTPGPGSSLTVAGTLSGVLDPVTGDVTLYDAGSYLVAGRSFGGDEFTTSWVPDAETNESGVDDSFSFTVGVPFLEELFTADVAFEPNGGTLTSSVPTAGFEQIEFAIGTTSQVNYGIFFGQRLADGTLQAVAYLYASTATTLDGTTLASEPGGTIRSFNSLALSEGWNEVFFDAVPGDPTQGEPEFSLTFPGSASDTSGFEWLAIPGTAGDGGGGGSVTIGAGTLNLSPDFTSAVALFEPFGGDATDGYNTDLRITTGDVFAGPATEIYFEVWDNDAGDDIVDGTYTLSATPAPGTVTVVDYADNASVDLANSTLTAGSYITPLTVSELEEQAAFAGLDYILDAYDQITGGTLDVTFDDLTGSYTFTWDFSLAGGGALAGSYTGVPTVNDGGGGGSGPLTYTGIVVGDSYSEAIEPGASLGYTFTAGANASHTIAVTNVGSDIDWALFASQEDADSYLNPVAEAFTGGTVDEVQAVDLTPGVQYWLVVTEFDAGPPSMFDLLITVN